jgi:hypothetical protein
MEVTGEITLLVSVLGGCVALITIVSTILGVGWKLGQIASGIRLEVAELKGMMGVSSERIAQIERRVLDIEASKSTTAAPCRRKQVKR